MLNLYFSIIIFLLTIIKIKYRTLDKFLYDIIYWYSVCSIKINKHLNIFGNLSYYLINILKFIDFGSYAWYIQIYDDNFNCVMFLCPITNIYYGLPLKLDNRLLDSLHKLKYKTDVHYYVLTRIVFDSKLFNFVSYKRCFQTIPYTIIQNKCKYEFIHIELIYNENAYEKIHLTIDLNKDNCNYNIVDNCLDEKFIKYYIINVLKREINNNFSYNLGIIDSDFNEKEFNENNLIVLTEDGYFDASVSTQKNINLK